MFYLAANGMADFVATFISILASHPPLYLHEICVQILQGTDEKSDTDLIQNFSEVLQRVTGSREERSFNDGVCEFSLIIMGIINTINMQSIPKRRKTNSGSGSGYPATPMKIRSTASSSERRHSPFPTPPRSDIHFSSHALLNNFIPSPPSPPQEATAGGFDANFDFSTWDNIDIVPVELITPTDSGFGSNESGHALQAEEYSAKMTTKHGGGLGRALLETLDFLNSPPR